MTTEQHFATAYDAVADMMEKAKASPQKAAIELLLDTAKVFIAELKAATVAKPAAKAEGTREYHTHNTHNGHRYDVQAEQSVANQQNVYQQANTTHQYIYHEAQANFRDIWVLPGNVSIDMASVEYYDREAGELHLRSGKHIAIKPHQVNRLLSWYYMKGLLTPPRQVSKDAKHGVSQQGKIPNDEAKTAALIADIKRQLEQNAKR